MKWHRIWAVTRTDLRQLIKSRDYWLPMGLLAILFFVVIPIVALNAVTSVQNSQVAQQIGTVLDTLPVTIQENIQGETAGVRAAYAIAVYLLAPIAIVVPLTIAAAVGSNTIVGERERGTGEFLAHSPITEKELYAGKLLAALIPGYLATLTGFGVYSLLVNLIVGPDLGGWFFPTSGWWVLILWVVPPAIAIALSLIVRISARVQSAAAAQQAASLVSLPVIVISYAVASGLVYDPARTGLLTGLVAWTIAYIGLASGSRALRREILLGIGIKAKKRVKVPRG
ncbi:MAG: ABC transporter permease subunit [Acidimicrobiia bacterium]|nr:ABC transporter permease [Acidimicrobiia bacterium]NNF08809.1 ABC transporter permease subunit [Acidimicrobiia bacterium]NNL68915.1 ABC transporter permease subunit [Acidimicrobiia bacterium]